MKMKIGLIASALMLTAMQEPVSAGFFANRFGALRNAWTRISRNNPLTARRTLMAAAVVGGGAGAATIGDNKPYAKVVPVENNINDFVLHILQSSPSGKCLRTVERPPYRTYLTDPVRTNSTIAKLRISPEMRILVSQRLRAKTDDEAVVFTDCSRSDFNEYIRTTAMAMGKIASSTQELEQAQSRSTVLTEIPLSQLKEQITEEAEKIFVQDREDLVQTVMSEQASLYRLDSLPFRLTVSKFAKQSRAKDYWHQEHGDPEHLIYNVEAQ